MGHLHNGILLSCKKKENFTLCDSVDGPGECYVKWISQSEKDKYLMIAIFMYISFQYNVYIKY